MNNKSGWTGISRPPDWLSKVVNLPRPSSLACEGCDPSGSACGTCLAPGLGGREGQGEESTTNTPEYA